VLFDYVDRGGFAQSAFGRRPDTDHWQPLRLESTSAELAAAGWRLEDVVPMHAEYERWYAAFVARIETKRAEIVALAGAAGFAPVHELYRMMHEAVRAGVLGGATLHASAA
jgi:hypothetical protein